MPDQLPADKLANFERIMQLYKARLECMAEKDQTTALFSEELEKIALKEAAILAELDNHDDVVRMLGMPTARRTRTGPLRAYAASDNHKLEFRDYLNKHPGEQLTTAFIQKELSAHFGTGTVSGLLTYYGKRGLVKNSKRGMWTISKDINAK